MVSVITPMYNAAAYIEKTIKSVLAQTYSDWEMIICDDCSTDNSAEIVHKYMENDSRIKYIKNQKNSGVAETRNAAVSASSGRYIAFLDSDDLWKPDKLSRQLELIERTGAALVYAGCDTIDENDNSLNKIREVPESITYDKLLYGNVMPCLTVMVDREKAKPLMPQVRHEDYACWLSILKEAGTAYGINEPLGSYRVNKSSTSSNKLKAMSWHMDILKREGLSAPKRLICFASYAVNAVRKRV